MSSQLLQQSNGGPNFSSEVVCPNDLLVQGKEVVNGTMNSSILQSSGGVVLSQAKYQYPFKTPMTGAFSRGVPITLPGVGLYSISAYSVLASASSSGTYAKGQWFGIVIQDTSSSGSGGVLQLDVPGGVTPLGSLSGGLQLNLPVVTPVPVPQPFVIGIQWTAQGTAADTVNIVVTRYS
jgi:hypothetical protein